MSTSIHIIQLDQAIAECGLEMVIPLYQKGTQTQYVGTRPDSLNYRFPNNHTIRGRFVTFTDIIKTKRANPVKWICPYWKTISHDFYGRDMLFIAGIGNWCLFAMRWRYL